MKNHIRGEIERAARDLGIDLRPLTAGKSLEIRDRLSRDHSTEHDRSTPFSYQVLKGYEAFRSPESWKMATRALEASPVLFFVNPDEDLTVWELNSSDEVHRLLGESFGFPFYMASPDLGSLVCVDDHDILYGVGESKEAVSALKEDEDRKDS